MDKGKIEIKLDSQEWENSDSNNEIFERKSQVLELKKNRNIISNSIFKKENIGNIKNQETKKINEKKPIIFSASNILDWVISFSLGALFFGLPLYFTGYAMQGIVFEKQIFFYLFILLALVAWVAKGVTTGELEIKKTPLDIPIIAFVLSYAFATILSVDKWHSFWGFFGDPSRGLLNLLMLVVAYYLIVNTFSYNRLRGYLSFFLISGFIVSAWTLLVELNFSWMSNISGKIVPANVLGTSPISMGIFLAMIVPLLMSVIFVLHFWETKKTFSRILLLMFAYLNLFLNVGLICVLFSAVPVVALLIGLGIFFIFILGNVIKIPKIATWLPAVIFSLALVFTFTGGFSIYGVNSANQNVPYSVYWDSMTAGIKQNFFFGNGPATYGYVYAQNHPQSLNDSSLFGTILYQARGVVFELLATIGTVGTIFFFLLLLTFFGVCIFLLSKKGQWKVLSLGLFSSALIYLISLLTIQVEGGVLIIGGLISMLAFATIILEPANEQKSISLSLKASPKYALALAFIFIIVSAMVVYAFVFVGRMYAADLYAGNAARQKEISENGSSQMLAKAILFSDQREGRYMTRLGQEYAYMANKEILKGEKDRNLDLLKGYLNNAVQWSELGWKKMDKDVVATEALAQVYESAGLYVTNATEASAKYYQIASDLDPNNPAYLVKLGQAKISAATSQKDDAKKGYLEEAKKYFQKAIEKKNNYSPAIFNQGLVNEALGDLDGAINDVQNAFLIENKSSIVYAYNLARLMQQRNKGSDLKNAESLFKDIITLDDKEINSHFSLGLIYEKTNRKSEASSEYKKIIEILGESSPEVRTKLQKMIDNIKNGIENTPESLGITNGQQAQPESQSQMPSPSQSTSPQPQIAPNLENGNSTPEQLPQ
jgi:tetratricopeptide (TPR) repeat protein